MASKLTEMGVARITPPKSGRIELWDSLLPGFGLRISDRGTKSWIVMYRSHGRLRRLTLGRYPVLTLAEARDEAREALKAAQKGRDPATEKQLAKKVPAEEPKRDTFKAVADEFVERYAKKRHDRWRETEQLIANKLLPAWSKRPIDSIGRRDVIEVLDREMDAGRERTANKTLALIRKLINWCLERGIVEASPVANIKAPGREVARDRILTDEELALVWHAAGRLGWPWAHFVRLLIVTGQRRDEVVHMAGPDVDFERRVWRLPRELTKADRAHEVPLSDLAVEILDDMPWLGDGLVFPAGGRSGGANPISGYSKMKRRLDSKIATAKAERRLGRPLRNGEATSTEDAMTPWRLHDLRRTAASGMARLGHPPHVVAAVLNHAPSGTQGITALYNRYRYGDEKRAALDAWSREVGRIIGREAGDVIALPQQAAK